MRPAPLSLTFPGARKPAAHPFAGGLSGSDLPSGSRVTVLLGAGSAMASGRRVVSGTVRGYVVRVGDLLDVQLTDITTWIVGPVPIDMETIGTPSTVLVRVVILQSLAYTASLLLGDSHDGRSQLSAVEVPYRFCWGCSRELGTLPGAGAARPDIFCRHCARRVHLGRPEGRPVVPPPSELRSACPACWCPDAGVGAYCPACGIERALASGVGAPVGSTLRVRIVSEHRRLATVSGTITALHWTRLSEQGWPQLVAELANVRVLSGGLGAETGPALTGEATLAVSLPVDRNGVVALLASIAAGGSVRGAEIARVCPACAQGETVVLGRLKRVLGRFCGDCGTRLRLAPHPSWASHWPVRRDSRAVVRHGCGTPVAPSRTPFCEGCGEHVGAGSGVEAPPSVANRFSGLAEELD